MMSAAMRSLLAAERPDASRKALHAMASKAVDVTAIAAAAWPRRRAAVVARAVALEADSDSDFE